MLVLGKWAAKRRREETLIENIGVLLVAARRCLFLFSSFSLLHSFLQVQRDTQNERTRVGITAPFSCLLRYISIARLREREKKPAAAQLRPSTSSLVFSLATVLLFSLSCLLAAA